MKKHAIDSETYRKLIELEYIADFRSCRDILENAVSSFEIPEGTDLEYEQAAAHLRLAIYNLICDEHVKYAECLDKAREVISETDILALSAQWLERSETHRAKVSELCDEFFKLVDEEYEGRDETSKYYFQLVTELRKRIRL
ncbi:hypothetical protein [Neogemmobacter tilapiae]|uniref:Uncharacterized protein n=1 Tax=Neogemmobacter tilapiae TaxID=875041 RepID=A0A918TZY6_9RHOB|nr:hypothetical protein [Gemmobacter tilapiae]GHC67210.1 hypothetical protein GCM10007315_35330 [Gemmobacter tilapiae]